MGQLVRFGTPESRHETGPIQNPDGSVVISAGRLDNRDELIDALDIAGARDRVTNTQLIAAAFLKWRGDTPRRLYGDWAFAAWDPGRRQLFLARDQFGNTALYYHRNENTFAFASSRKALFALPHVPRRLNELRLAQHLVVWVADGAATFHEEIFRVPPGHALTATASGVTDDRYWQPEHIPDLRLPADDAYVERFVELFSDAVRVRLRTTGPAVATLSSGLDSGAVTAFAARELRDRGQSLLAFSPFWR
jgi:asparagine synthase (glutamine-hydrolysing)